MTKSTLLKTVSVLAFVMACGVSANALVVDLNPETQPALAQAAKADDSDGKAAVQPAAISETADDTKVAEAKKVDQDAVLPSRQIVVEPKADAAAEEPKDAPADVAQGSVKAVEAEKVEPVQKVVQERIEEKAAAPQKVVVQEKVQEKTEEKVAVVAEPQKKVAVEAPARKDVQQDAVVVNPHQNVRRQQYYYVERDYAPRYSGYGYGYRGEASYGGYQGRGYGGYGRGPSCH